MSPYSSMITLISSWGRVHLFEDIGRSIVFDLWFYGSFML
jgi:hypothetical protein